MQLMKACSICGQACATKGPNAASPWTRLAPKHFWVGQTAVLNDWTSDFHVVSKNASGQWQKLSDEEVQLVDIENRGRQVHLFHHACLRIGLEYYNTRRSPIEEPELLFMLSELLNCLPKITNLSARRHGRYMDGDEYGDNDPRSPRREIPWHALRDYYNLNGYWDAGDPDKPPSITDAVQIWYRQPLATTAGPATHTLLEDMLPTTLLVKILIMLPKEDQKSMRMLSEVRAINLTTADRVQSMQYDARYPEFSFSDWMRLIRNSTKDPHAESQGPEILWEHPTRGLLVRIAELNQARRLICACMDEIMVRTDMMTYFGNAVYAQPLSLQHNLVRTQMKDCVRFRKLWFPSLAISQCVNPADIESLSDTGKHNPAEFFIADHECLDMCFEEYLAQDWPEETTKLTSVIRLPDGIGSVKSIIVYGTYLKSPSMTIKEDNCKYSQGVYVVGLKFITKSGQQLELGYCQRSWREDLPNGIEEGENLTRRNGWVRTSSTHLEDGYAFHGMIFECGDEARITRLIFYATDGTNMHWQQAQFGWPEERIRFGYGPRRWDLGALECLGLSPKIGMVTWIFPKAAPLVFSCIQSTDGGILSLEMHEEVDIKAKYESVRSPPPPSPDEHTSRQLDRPATSGCFVLYRDGSRAIEERCYQFNHVFDVVPAFDEEATQSEHSSGGPALVHEEDCGTGYHSKSLHSQDTAAFESNGRAKISPNHEPPTSVTIERHWANVNSSRRSPSETSSPSEHMAVPMTITAALSSGWHDTLPTFPCQSEPVFKEIEWWPEDYYAVVERKGREA